MPSAKFFVLFAFLLLGGCSDVSDPVKLSVPLDDSRLEALITDIEDRGKVTFVHGKLSAHNLEGKAVLDISTVKLEVGNSRSSPVYVDSVAHYLTDRIPIVDDTLSIDVYWVFEGDLSAEQRNSIRLVVDK